MQTTTFYSFGEETVTALEAINIMIEEDFPAKAALIESWMKEGFVKLREKYPKEIHDVRTEGAISGVFFRKAPKLLESLVKLLPGDLFKDERFISKLVTSAVVSELYNKHNILSFTSLGDEIHLIASPPLIIEQADSDSFFRSLDAVLESGLVALVLRFAKQRFIK